MEDRHNAVLSIDTRRHTIRIHQATYRMLGQPRVVELLLNPGNRTLVLLCADADAPGGQGLKVYSNKRSCDLRSKALITRIQDTLGLMNGYGNYRVRGVVNEAGSIAVFPMDCMRAGEGESRGENRDGNTL